MKLADLKRLPVGTEMRLTFSLMGPCDKARKIAKVSTTAIQFTGDGIPDGRTSYLSFPKAADFKPTETGFEIYEGATLCARYLFK